jgi:rfaE bifunctional protein nucleotidyltransferase chain/domain
VSKIVTVDEIAPTLQKLKSKNKKIILVGGCFDILHLGHIKFLEDSKKHADILILLLESDENIRKYKGENRPINSQKNRSIVLSSLKTVDLIIPLEGMTKNEDYDKLIVQIKPDFIALTRGDKNISHRKKQCDMIGAKLIEIQKVENLSSTGYINSIN